MNFQDELDAQRRYYIEKDRRWVEQLEVQIRKMESLNLSFPDLDQHRKDFIESWRAEADQYRESIRKRGG